MFRLLFASFLILNVVACANDASKSDEPRIEAIEAEPGPNASIIRNPITADGPMDTVNVAKIEFAEEEFDFGSIKEGEVVKHTYAFTNTGKAPLLISNARSTCGCTVPEWPQEPIAPGESGKIEVQFNSKGKKQQQNKYVTITANTNPAQTKVLLKGFVEAGE